MPASYPGTIKVFTTKRNVLDPVYAADPNTLQEEVVAVQQIVDLNPHVSTAGAGSSLGGYSSLSRTYASLSDRIANSEAGHLADTHPQYLKTGAKATDADRLDGFDSAKAATADTVAVRSATGTLAVASPALAGEAATRGWVEGLNYLPSTGGTYTGTLTSGAGGRLLRPLLSSAREEMATITTTGATILFLDADAAARNVYRLTFAGAVTITWSGIPAAGSGLAVAATLICVGVTSIAWPVGTKFNSGTAPAINGQTWFSCVAQEGVVTVGTSFAAVA